MNNKNKLQKVMNDFDMDRNYLKIIRRRKRKNYYFYFKMITVPFCIIIFTCYLLMIQNDNKFDRLDKKSINITESALDIYSVIDRENSWAYDVSNTKILFEKSDIIVKVKVLKIGESTYEYTPKLSPTTPIYVETLEILKGSVDKNINMILKRGGSVTVRDFIENSPSTSVNKMGLNNLTEEEKNTKYIIYNESGNYDLEVGKIYVVALKKDDNGVCYISANGYSVFEISAKELYTNVLTGQKLILE